MQSGLPHETEQSHCFQRDGLATGVWSCNYQQGKIPAHMNINGNDLCCVDQRVASLFDLNIPFLGKKRTCTVHFFGEHGTCKDKVEFR